MRGMEQLIIAKRGAFTDRRIENDAVYYSASMRLAAALYNAARHRDAYLEADSLLHEIHKSLAALAKPPLESPLGRLLEKVRRWPVITHLALRIENRQRAREIERLHPIRRYLEQLLPSVEIMHIGLGVACGQPVRPLLLGDRAWMPSAEYQYNLACTLSLMGARASETQLTAKFFNDALDHLGLALRLEHQMVNLARQDTSLCDLRNARRKEFRGILRRWTPPSPAVPTLPKVAEAAETAPPTVSPPKGRSSRPQRLQSL
jgi:hypothetical protein